MFLFSPLEQFQILPIISLNFGIFDFSITNATVILAFGLLTFLLTFHSILAQNETCFVAPKAIQYITELFYGVVYSLLNDNVGSVGKSFFPYVFTLFIFILISNIIGLVPYSFTLTSHLIVTFTLALMTFVGINIICIKEHGINMFSLFLPSGSSIFLALLLIPIEIVSYFFRPISLSVRLFANMMAGHTLLKVIIGFAWVMMLAGGGLLVAHTIPLLILVILMFLELGVACIQAYVFSILVCIYLNDAIHLH